jgi:hypothetical protein
MLGNNVAEPTPLLGAKETAAPESVKQLAGKTFHQSQGKAKNTR